MPEYVYSPRGHSSPGHKPGFGDCIPGEIYTTDDPGIAADPDFKPVRPANVKDHGAKGDGAPDDSAAIAAAVSRAGASKKE